MGNVVAPLWAECSACTRLIVVGYPVLSILLIFAEQSAPWLIFFGFICSVETVVQHFCVWTMFTAAFFRQFAGGMSFLMMLFEVYMGMVQFPSREKELGSSSFLIWIFAMNFFINIIYLAVMYLASKAVGEIMGPRYLEAPNEGLWPLLFLCITMQCLANIDSSTSFWGVVNIPNKWYPIALFGFFCLLSQNIMWNVAAALVIGYFYDRLRPERCLPSRVWTSGVENRCCGQNGRSCLGASWIRAADTAGYELESGDRRYATLSDFGRSGQNQQLARRDDEQRGSSSSSSGGNFIAFAGSGNRLGEADTEVPLVPLAADARELGPMAQRPETNDQS